MRVVLTDAQLDLVHRAAAARQSYAVKTGIRDKFETIRQSGLMCHTIGVAGEIATAIALHARWSATVGILTAADVGDAIEVRTRRRPGPGDLALTVRDKRKAHRLFVLAHAWFDGDDLRPEIDILGWIKGTDGIRRRYWRDSQAHKPHGICFVPPADLRAIGELDAYLERQHHERTHPLTC